MPRLIIPNEIAQLKQSLKKLRLLIEQEVGNRARLEEVVNDHPKVVESAVIGYNEEIRGECPLAFVVLRGSGAKDMSPEE